MSDFKNTYSYDDSIIDQIMSEVKKLPSVDNAIVESLTKSLKEIKIETDKDEVDFKYCWNKAIDQLIEEERNGKQN